MCSKSELQKCFCGLERYEWIQKDRELKKERAREKETIQTTTAAATTLETIQHWSHSHPLTYSQPQNYRSFRCDSCDRRSEGTRYHCAACEFDLHLTCAQIHVTRLVHHMTATQMDAALGEQQRGEIINNSFAHPAHELVTDYRKEAFKCAHCNNPGDGLRFRCHVCDDVQFHQVCARNPTKISSHLFPTHELELKLSPILIKCRLCGAAGGKNAFIYCSKEFDFYLHPECTQWPLYLAHPLHPPHPLVLKPCGADGSDIDMNCSACDQTIGRYNSYKYCCKLCGLDFHLSCILRFSKLGMGRGDEEVKSECYPADQCFSTVLPVTNLVLPNFDWKKPHHPSPGIRWGVISYLGNATSSAAGDFST